MKPLVFPFIAILFLGYVYPGPDYETKPMYQLDKLGKEFAKKHQMKFLNCSGRSYLTGSDECLWSLNLISRENMTIEEARPIVKLLTTKLLEKMYNDPLFKNFQVRSLETNKEPKYEALTDHSMGFRLSFWDKEMNRPLYPYLAQIRLAEGKLFYHYADPKTQALLDPVVEIIK